MIIIILFLPLSGVFILACKFYLALISSFNLKDRIMTILSFLHRLISIMSSAIYDNFYFGPPPKVHKYLSSPCSSSLELEFTSCLSHLDYLITNLQTFIVQFQQIAELPYIEVATDGQGNLEIYADEKVPEGTCNELKTKVGILDRLINTRKGEISHEFNKGSKIAEQLKLTNPELASKLEARFETFTRTSQSHKY